MRCPEVAVEFLPAVLGSLPLSVYQSSPSPGAVASPSPGAVASPSPGAVASPSPDAVGGGGGDGTGGSELVSDDQEGVLGLLKFLQTQTEKHSYPTSLLEGVTTDPICPLLFFFY